MSRRRLGYATRVVRAVASDPLEAFERARERIAERRERRLPPCRYRSEHDWERRLHELVGVAWPCEAAEEFPALWSEVTGLLRGERLAVGRGAYAGWDDSDPALARAAWCLTRHLRPRHVVETGVARGITSRFVLEGLERNRAGRLWSIDLPPFRDRELRAQIGAAVPAPRRDPWTLIEGSSRRRLPRLLRELGEIDLFIHDSLHTARNLRFELDRAWPALTPGGFALADDVHRNCGFRRFTAATPEHCSLVCPSDDERGLFGVIQKTGGGYGGSKPI